MGEKTDFTRREFLRAGGMALAGEAPNGRDLARNIYLDPFNHLPLPEGYPLRMDPDIGMRLWWAGEEK